MSPECNENGVSVVRAKRGKNSHEMIIYCQNETTSSSVLTTILHILGEILNMRFCGEIVVLRVGSNTAFKNTDKAQERKDHFRPRGASQTLLVKAVRTDELPC